MRIIAGEARGKKLLPPTDRGTRPPLDWMRESIFSMLAGSFEGGGVLDLFAGIGAFGLEAVSRGAARGVFVEQDRGTLSILKKNVEALGFGKRSEVLSADALLIPDLASQPVASLALVFLDPPFKLFRDAGATERLFRRLEVILASPALSTGSVVILRQPRKFEVACPVPASERRAYGESVVQFFAGPT